ncbi:MAG: NAD-dependent epimerase/dehydratase family protein [Solirubrobacteraceae bacterium]
MRYVVTGGTGYIGTRLVEHLIERDDTERVVIADVRPPRSFRLEAAPHEPRDLRDRDARARGAGRLRRTREGPRAGRSGGRLSAFSRALARCYARPPWGG